MAVWRRRLPRQCSDRESKARWQGKNTTKREKRRIRTRKQSEEEEERREEESERERERERERRRSTVAQFRKISNKPHHRQEAGKATKRAKSGKKEEAEGQGDQGILANQRAELK
ncbi:hypothetical protein TESG_08440 [Trichophyton tonsurans CBS 112818]|uniref:Uncharacterized protein n=1 Tax=Trichophyton tonsurans (strain CBS 112818) TaxID=647933 RepID=F2RYM6_TRIT1|nr:hypothetical protein TESG_08440 [Trichophyton tonsurans CBS 112818]